jgi:hypothetical protein
MFWRGREFTLVILLSALAASVLTTNLQSSYGSAARIYPTGQSGIRQTPESVVAAFDAALNAHDVNAALNLFAESGVVHDLARETYSSLKGEEIQGTLEPTCRMFGDEPVCTYSGKDRIGEWLHQLALENVQVQESGVDKVSGDNVTWNLAISIDPYRSLGVAPLSDVGQALVQGRKIQSLTLSLSTESISKLSAAFYNASHGKFTVITNVFLLGIVFLGLALPAASTYYIFRVKSLFAAVPRLERPWFLLLGGVASLFMALLLLVVRNAFTVSTPYVDLAQYLFVVLTGGFILAAMVLMKRVWTITPSG